MRVLSGWLGMRGSRTSGLVRCFRVSISSGACRKDHPLRAIRTIVSMWRCPRAEWRVRGDMYCSHWAAPRLHRKSCCEPCYFRRSHTVRSERQLMERLEFDLLFRWFVGLGIDDRVWDHSVFSKNRERLLEEAGDCCPVPHVHSRSGRDPEASVRRALPRSMEHWWRPGRA